ncbi:hypothetical protein [Paraburkholderia sp.]|uniref:hypothetical protein n=1 Tax=Paraburkholderia sp. TaxID=1926495 RepID=UPI003D6FD942
MSARPFSDRSHSIASPRPPARWQLERGQIAMHDVAAHTSIVAVTGDIDLTFRDHALAWLGADMPIVRVTVREGERYRIEQRGAIWLTATTHANGPCVVHAESARTAYAQPPTTWVRVWFANLRSRMRRWT